MLRLVNYAFNLCISYLCIRKTIGKYAVVIDCANGHELHKLNAAPGRYFYGHGVFSQDGSLLFTTENDYQTALGVIGNL
ncbi:MAG: DUF1513 domain-containing protein [Aestuariivita sp.]|nr:DUF1513 domain-containing protein [Aestuariivita sp.]MCY4201176.1 DUF1513 domain-containing protein [Aestuariivita sp.]MCY4289842.1 DUF1513 domain-containing protein [Aestuariivita sp.]